MRSGNDAGGTVGRDVGRDEGRDQETWRDLVARLEIPAFIEPTDAPWPDRENLHPKTTLAAASPAACTTPADQVSSAATSEGDQAEPEASKPDPAPEAPSPRPTPADRSRVIRPAGFTRFCEPIGPASTPPGRQANSETTADQASPAGPRDYAVADEDDLDDRYIPPPVPPQPKLDPVAKGAWLALFGGPGYLLVATLLNWQLAGGPNWPV